MNKSDIQALAEQLFHQHISAEGKTADAYSVLPASIDESYEVQNKLCELYHEHGWTPIGYKAGVTNRETLNALGGEEPLTGVLFDAFSVPDRGEVDGNSLIAPKIEAEIAFVLKDELSGPGCHAGNVLAATDFVIPAIEIVDSRIITETPELRYIAADNVAASTFVLGGRSQDIASLDMRTLGVVVDVNGEDVATGAGAAVWGHPAESVATLVNLLAERGQTVDAGSLILSGSLIPPTPVEPGASIRMEFQHLGSVSVSIGTGE